MFLYCAVFVIAAAGAALLAYFKYQYLYWKRKNVPYFQPSIPFGNIKNSYTRQFPFGERLKLLYLQFKEKQVKHGGIYMISVPVYFPINLDYIKNILNRDFSHFVDRGLYVNAKADPLGANLISLEGKKWRHLRHKLTSTFTPAKLKAMYVTLLECSRNIEKAMDKEIANSKAIDIKEITASYTTDVIGSCAFGLDCQSFEDPDSPFRKYGKAIFRKSRRRALKGTLTVNFPKLAAWFGVSLSSPEVTNFFLGVVKDTVMYREANNFRRNDFMQLMIDLKNEPIDDPELKVTVEDVAAHCFAFFVAGFETSSTLLALILYELALNPDIQDKVRSEIEDAVGSNGEVGYDELMGLKYTDQVIDEGIRKYPVLPFLSRKCIKDYQVPGTDLVIPEGMRCIISVMGIHHDEEYYSSPEVFDPERFSEENKRNRHSFAYLPFGEGPRNCIGSKFGKLQTKVGLVTLVKNYRFKLSPLTETPLKFSPTSLVLTPLHTIMLIGDKV